MAQTKVLYQFGGALFSLDKEGKQTAYLIGYLYAYLIAYRQFGQSVI
jgi:hypothetical protein